MKRVDRDTIELIQTAQMTRNHGVMPVAGGWGDQTLWYQQASQFAISQGDQMKADLESRRLRRG